MMLELIQIGKDVGASNRQDCFTHVWYMLAYNFYF
jgi:hypothetical protein